MSALQSGVTDFGCSRFETIKHALSLLDEQFNRVKGVLDSERRGRIYQYAYGHIAFQVEFWNISDPANKYYLLLHGIPFEWRVSDAALPSLEIQSYFPATNRAFEADADSVLAVYDCRYLPDQVIAAGVPIPSLVWVLRSDEVPELFMDEMASCPFVYELPFEIGIRVIRPRVMTVLDRPADCLASSEQRLVERVPSVIKRLCQLSADCGRGGINLPDNEHFLASFFITVFERGEVLTIDKTAAGNIRFGECVARPTNEILGALK